jgi:hypothetical protein
MEGMLMDEHLERVISAIDVANDADPTRITENGATYGAARLYGERMTAWLQKLTPEPSELLQIAVRAQHLERFTLPRSAYPMGKPGYFRWRNEQKRRHAARLTELMKAAGYSDEEADRAAAIVRKENLRFDPEVQLLEDCACLVFLQHEFADFAVSHPDEKVIDILAKSWAKMSKRAQEEASKLDLPHHLVPLVQQAVARGTT